MDSQPKQQKWIQIVLILVVFGIFVGAAIYYFSLYDKFNSENLQAFIQGFGPWAPLIYALIYIICAPIPILAIILSPLGGLLFGILWGSVLAILVATVSSLIPFTMSRRLGREWVESKLEGKKLEEIYKQSEGKNGFTFVMLMRLIPIFPWEIQSYIIGLTKVSVPTYIAATAVGIIPGTASLVILGDAIKDPTSWQFYTAIALNIIVMVGVPIINSQIQKRKKKQEEATV